MNPDKNLGNLIRVTIRRWTPVFEVALAVLFNVARDPDGAAPVSNSGGKVVNGRGLMESRQAALVILAL